MKRRRFLLGLGTLAVGGSAAFGTGAFTSLEANRHGDISVVTDSDAYLRMQPSDGPNGEYATLLNGELEIQMDAGNSNVAGSGVNREAVTTMDDVFTLRNQGSQPVVVWIDDPGFRAGDAVTFYTGSDPGAVIESRSAAETLAVGAEVGIGIQVDSHGLDGNIASGGDNFVVTAEATGSSSSVP